MRKIKFRAWDKTNKQMLLDKDLWIHIYPQKNIEETSVANFPDYHIGEQPNDISYDPRTDLEIMQYTGLKDKNGVEIYEGDLLKILDRDWPSQLDSHPEMNHQQYLDSITSLCEVVWDKGSFWLEQRKGKGYYYPNVAYDSRRDVCEVIGNIFENGDLLK